MGDFREMMAVCELKDLGLKGFPFAWCNNREGEHRISEKFDRFLVNHQWCASFPLISASHGLVAYSDHSLIWLDTNKAPTRKWGGPKLFGFEEMWVGEEKCTNIIK